MKLFLLIWTFLFFAISTETLGQKVESYDFMFTVHFLPYGGKYIEKYYKKGNDIKHGLKVFVFDIEGQKHDWKLLKEKEIKIEKKIETTINRLDSLFRLTEFKFTISKSIIDDINSDISWMKDANINSQDVDNFFKNKDTITLKIKDIIEPKYLFVDSLPNIHLVPGNQLDCDDFVIDGAPFNFELKFNRVTQDTIKYEFKGNLSGHVNDCNIKNWIPFYLAYRERNIFKELPLDRYFSDENLIYVLERFIVWEKTNKTSH